MYVSNTAKDKRYMSMNYSALMNDVTSNIEHLFVHVEDLLFVERYKPFTDSVNLSRAGSAGVMKVVHPGIHDNLHFC